MVSIATWNINSVRLRIDQVARFLTEQAPDVLCLQEIKCAEHLFPHEAFEQLGYVHRDRLGLPPGGTDAVFVVVNLFIAVVINNLEAARRESPAPASQEQLELRLGELRAALAALEESLRGQPRSRARG